MLKKSQMYKTKITPFQNGMQKGNAQNPVNSCNSTLEIYLVVKSCKHTYTNSKWHMQSEKLYTQNYCIQNRNFGETNKPPISIRTEN
jgi:hypothetical protein